MKRDSIKHFGDVLHLFLDILGQNIISNLKQSKKMYSSKTFFQTKLELVWNFLLLKFGHIFPNQTGVGMEMDIE